MLGTGVQPGLHSGTMPQTKQQEPQWEYSSDHKKSAQNKEGYLY